MYISVEKSKLQEAVCPHVMVSVGRKGEAAAAQFVEERTKTKPTVALMVELGKIKTLLDLMQHTPNRTDVFFNN